MLHSCERTLSQRGHANARNRCLDISHDERCAEPEHAISAANEHRITAGIRALTLAVIPAINLNDEPPTLRQKVSDVATKQRHLPPKHHPSRRPRMRSQSSRSDRVGEKRM